MTVLWMMCASSGHGSADQIALSQWDILEATKNPRINGSQRTSTMIVGRLLDISDREELYRWYLDNHQKISDFWIRVNRAAQDCPGVIRYVDTVEVALCFGWIDSTMKRIDAIKADPQAWEHYLSFPENYRRIKVDRIQHYQHTDRSEYAQRTLRKFISDCHEGRMQGGWSDFGRLAP